MSTGIDVKYFKAGEADIETKFNEVVADFGKDKNVEDNTIKEDIANPSSSKRIKSSAQSGWVEGLEHILIKEPSKFLKFENNILISSSSSGLYTFIYSFSYKGLLLYQQIIIRCM